MDSSRAADGGNSAAFGIGQRARVTDRFGGVTFGQLIEIHPETFAHVDRGVSVGGTPAWVRIYLDDESVTACNIDEVEAIAADL